MTIDPRIIERWKAEFPQEKMISMARDLDVPEPIIEQFAQIYNDICADWLEYKYEEGDEEFIRYNRIKKTCDEFFSNYQSQVEGGHSPKFAFLYARLRDDGEEDHLRAEQDAYRSMGHEAQKECELSGQSPLFAKVYIESVLGFDQGNLKEKAAKFEADYLSCLNKGYSELYAEQYAQANSQYDLDYAHHYAYCYELLVGGGLSDGEAGRYADKVLDFLSDSGSDWDDAVLQAESELFSEANDIKAELYFYVLREEYEKSDTPHFDSTGEWEKDCRIAAGEIMSKRFSIDGIKEKALVRYRSLYPS